MAQTDAQNALQKPLELLGRAPLILVPALVAGVVNVVLSLGLRGTVALWGGWTLFGVILVGGAVSLLSIAWATILLDQYLRGEKPDLQDSWVILARNFSNLLVAILVVLIIVAFGTLFFILPGILLEVIFIMTIPHVAKRNVTFDKALSFSLRFSFSGVNFLLLLLYVGGSFILSLIPFVGAFLSSIFLTVWIAYFYLKYGQEGEPEAR
ncbi:MAG: hypothetical protein ACUVTO_09695 [Candidatus Caldatribacteriaceae bacterium]